MEVVTAGRSLSDRVRALVPNRRMGLITADQVVSGASNLLIVLLVAHLLSPADFGWFTIYFLVYTLATTVQRSLISGPLLVYPHDADERPGAVIGAGLVTALSMAALCGLAGGALGAAGSARAGALVILAVLLPLLLLQDTGRYLSWAAGRPSRSLWLDLTWLLLLVAAFAGLSLASVPATLERCLLLWGGSGAIAGVLVFFQPYGFRPRKHLGLSWLRERWSFSWKYLVGATAAQLSVLASVSVITVVSNAAAVAAVRAVTLLVRPGYTVQVAVGQSVATDIARDEPRPGVVWKHVGRAVVLTGAVAVANIGVLLVLPDSLGRAVLGNTWPLAAPLLVPAGVQLLLSVVGTGTRDALLGLHRVTVVVLVDVVGAVILVGAAGVGALVADARGVLWALVAAQALMTLVWWVLFARTMERLDGPEAAFPAVRSAQDVG